MGKLMIVLYFFNIYIDTWVYDQIPAKRGKN